MPFRTCAHLLTYRCLWEDRDKTCRFSISDWRFRMIRGKRYKDEALQSVDGLDAPAAPAANATVEGGEGEEGEEVDAETAAVAAELDPDFNLDSKGDIQVTHHDAPCDLRAISCMRLARRPHPPSLPPPSR